MIATIILLVLIFFELVMNLMYHGEPRSPYNFWYTLCAVIIELVLYYYAGLFDKFM